MTIEVKQLQIKSTVLPEESRASNHNQACAAAESVRDEVLAECRKLVLELLRAERER